MHKKNLRLIAAFIVTPLPIGLMEVGLIPFAYLVALSCGIPIYFLFFFDKPPRFVNCILAGALIGSFSTGVYFTVVPSEIITSLSVLCWFGALFGFIGAIIFWLIAFQSYQKITRASFK